MKPLRLELLRLLHGPLGLRMDYLEVHMGTCPDTLDHVFVFRTYHGMGERDGGFLEELRSDVVVALLVQVDVPEVIQVYQCLNN